MSEDNDNGNGSDNSERLLKVVKLETSADHEQRHCVLKLRELLAQAEQGHYRQLCIAAIREDGSHSFHWTANITNRPQIIVGMMGALDAFKLILFNHLRFSK